MKLTRILSLLVALVAPVSVFAASGGTAIPGGDVSTPYVITQTGYYYLSGNRTMTDATKPAIEIKANDVTIDLNGYNLRNKPGNDGNKGLISLAETDNIEIRNGSLTDSAYAGILALDSDLGGRLLVRNVRFVGMSIGIHAIKLSGMTIENCTFDAITSRGVNVIDLAGELEIKNCAFSGYMGVWCNNSPFLIENSSFTVKVAMKAQYSSVGRFSGNKVVSSTKFSGGDGPAVVIMDAGSAIDICGNDFRMTNGGTAIETGTFTTNLTLVEGNTFRGGYAFITNTKKGAIQNNRLQEGTLFKFPGNVIPSSNITF